jgi:acetyl-CoA carboxylase biotin carboxyl carrier protein
MRCRFDLARGVVVSDGLSALKEEDVQRLARLIESLDSSNFDYLQLQVGDVKVTIGKGAVPMSAPAIAAPAPPVAVAEVPIYAPAPRPASVAAAPEPVQTRPSAKRAASAAPAGTIEIKAQIMGMFYAQPEPGAPPFVVIGAEVKKDTTVCLIEVMKTFNAMNAGVNGVITEICAEDSQLVEYGQVLFRVRPS